MHKLYKFVISEHSDYCTNTGMYQCFAGRKTNYYTRCQRQSANPSHVHVHFCWQHQPGNLDWRPFPVCCFRSTILLLCFLSPSVLMDWNFQKIYTRYEKCDFDSHKYLCLPYSEYNREETMNNKKRRHGVDISI